MRLMFLFFLIIFTQNGVAQNNSIFDESDYQTIIKRAKEEHKPVLLMLYATWCPHCNKMKNEVLADHSVISFLDKNFICTKQDTEEIQGIMLKSKFEMTSQPTFIILDSNENELYRLKGEIKTADFIAEIKNALDPKLQLPYFEKAFLLDTGNPVAFMDYINVLKKGRDRDHLNEKAKIYFDSQTDTQLVSAINWQIIANCVTDISSREFQYALKHQKEFEAVSSPLRVERKIINIVMESLKPFAERMDTLNYSKQRIIAKTINLQKTDSLIFNYDLMITEGTKNWNEYKSSTLESTDKFAWNDGTLLKDISRNYLKYITDRPSLKEAVKWTTRSLILNDTFDGNLLLSNLYLKINDKKSAITAARKAKLICTAYNFNSKDVDELFIKLGITK
jgi:thioredoxin-related protein